MKELLEILHDIFYTPPGFEELNAEIDSCSQQLREILDKPNRRSLMHIIDSKDHIRNRGFTEKL
jgi:hypothetical protein